MSHPPTEAAEVVSNDSLFSDSLAFDRAEKPISELEANQHADDFNDPSYIHTQEEGHSQLNEMLTADPEGDRSAYDSADVRGTAAIPVEENPLLKKRAHPPKGTAEWAPLEPFDIPGGDPEDEFGIATALRPVPAAAQGSRKGAGVFIHGEPDMEGNEEITNCFDEPGLLYRIINKRNRTWAFYNDSVAFEIHVTCTFGPQSKIEALENTAITKNEKKEFVAQVVVYPGETEMFVKGFVNGFTSKLRAVPLSDEYYTSRTAAQQGGIIDKELEQVRQVMDAAGIAADNTEAALQACIDANIPFVDLSFPPIQESVEKGSARKFKVIPWARPRQYLQNKIYALKCKALQEGRPLDGDEFDDQVRLFRRPITPGTVDGGDLGDCWLQCAVAMLSENETAVVNMFRHPRGAEFAKAERKVGAYRVTFNKNGLWRSIIVDDYFPVVGAKLKFARMVPCGTGDEDFEIWPAVLQKAYAKMHGSYAAIMSGDPVHALTDLTGAPSYRFDEAFNEATVNGGEELFRKLQSLAGDPRTGHAYQVLLTTPGKAPALVPGALEVQYDFNEEPEVAEALRGTNLLPGHAYGVLQVKEFPREGIKLVQVRNPWPYTYGEDVSIADAVPWGPGSPLWVKHTSIARECGVGAESAAPAGGHSPGQATRWFSWEDVLRYFSGGGVVYQDRTQQMHVETRIPITFSDCRPSLIFELTVDTPTEVIMMLSNMDHRGTRGEGVDSDDNAEYPPVMLSLAMQNEKHAAKEGRRSSSASASVSIAPADVFRVVLNTAADVTAPSTSKWTFLQARDIAMRATLTPEDSPYYLIPRLMEDEATMGGSGAHRQPCEVDPLYAHLEQVHFANDYARLHPAEASECAGRKEIPVTVGIIGGEVADAVGIHLRTIRGSNPVFENYPKFPTEGEVAVNAEDVYFQTKEPSVGFAAEKLGHDVY